MFLCGITTIGQGLVRSYQGLVAMRFLLGFFEAGLLPGCVYLISMYYKRYEFQRRLSVFYVSGILAGVFGPVNDKEFGEDGNNDCKKAFQNEYPTPPEFSE